MSYIRKAKIAVFLDGFNIQKSKEFVATEDEIYAEADDWMNEIALNYIAENDIEDPWEQDLVIGSAGHAIEWEIEEPHCMYVVYENENVEDPVYGVYPTRADAEEAILAECEGYAYEVMMTADPLDVFSCAEWDWKIDYKWLVEDAMKTFAIQEVPVYGIKEVIE